MLHIATPQTTAETAARATDVGHTTLRPPGSAAPSSGGTTARRPWRDVPPGTGWWESYLGGYPAAEAEKIRAFATQITEVQENLRRRAHAPVATRAFHAKIHAGVTNAQFEIAAGIPEDLRTDFLRPGTAYPAAVRFSNASGTAQPDAKPDLRGLAVRVTAPGDAAQDFLATNAPASHARDAYQFMVAARAASSRWKVLALPRLLAGLGPFETVRLLGVVARSSRTIASMATETYWSRSPFAVGPVAVKFLFRPAANPASRQSPSSGGADDAAGQGDTYLRDDLVARLRQGPIVFDFCVQRYLNPQRTPIEDGSTLWRDSDAPPVAIARLTIPQQDLASPEAVAATEAVNTFAFNPWNMAGGFRPLGSLNRARKAVYVASAEHRQGE